MKTFRILLLCALLLAACDSPKATSSKPTVPATPPPSPSATPVPPTATFTAIPPTKTPAPTATSAPRFAADPQRIEFESADGTKLVGYYYPAAVDPAPAVVLLHWVGGSNCEWLAVNLVQWLQNRFTPEGVAANPACANAEIIFTLAPSEYPAPPEGRSYAVFAFDYRGHGESGGKMDWLPDEWRADSIAAVQAARALPGVDPERVATIGASIGADGAIDGCGEGCLGALSFSPGNYLNMAYKDAVKTLDEEQKPAWCIASRKDGESFPTCESASGEFYTESLYEEQAHGMAFFDPKFDPKTTQNIYDFLATIFGE